LGFVLRWHRRQGSSCLGSAGSARTGTWAAKGRGAARGTQPILAGGVLPYAVRHLDGASRESDVARPGAYGRGRASQTRRLPQQWDACVQHVLHTPPRRVTLRAIRIAHAAPSNGMPAGGMSRRRVTCRRRSIRREREPRSSGSRQIPEPFQQPVPPHRTSAAGRHRTPPMRSGPAPPHGVAGHPDICPTHRPRPHRRATRRV
jgi:hypothetical protein